MQKVFKIITAFGFLSCIAAFVLLFIVQTPITHSAEITVVVPAHTTVATSTLPVRLIIPKISVNAAVESLGIAADGSMAVPVGPDDVAWFDLGAQPGDVGAAVIAGHSGWKDNIPAVFDNLYKLTVGDEIFVQNTDGTTAVFVVQGKKTYTKNADSSAVFNANDGKAHLNLITCAGAWNNVTKSSADRTVIFAEKLSEN